MRRGQVALYLICALVLVALFVIADVYIYVQIRGKMIIENAGDAAAVAAAARMGELINEIGALNVEHAKLSPTFEQDKADELVLKQRRLCLIGPIEAYAEIQQVAREEGAEDNDEFAAILNDHIKDVIEIYMAGDPYTPSYEGAWAEYANALSVVAGNGVAAASDNTEYYGLAAHELLTNQQFYQAINGKEWCWFYFNAYSTLQNYQGYNDWGGFVVKNQIGTENSEIMNLHLRAYTGKLTDIVPLKELRKMIPKVDEDMVESEKQTWFIYDDNYLTEWESIKYGFPVVSEPKAEYDYLGSAAVLRCNRGDDTWIGAAKPFGSVRFPVLPQTFTMARLIPTDTAPGANMYTAEKDWVQHLRAHLVNYVEDGSYAAGCYYCGLLRTWDKPSFRHKGIYWLKFHHNECVRPTTSGGRVISGKGGCRGY